MKEPKRYYCGNGEGMFEDNKNGDWIEYSEHKTIVEELFKPLNCIKNQSTVVDWLYEQIEQSLLTVGYSGTKYKMPNLKKQAKEFEKNQIIDAWKDNRDMIYYDEDKDELSESTKIELAEQYYKEKYGDEN